MPKEIRQWRFMWRGATGEEMGAQWVSRMPTDEEIQEWKEDFFSFRIETRTVQMNDPEVIYEHEKE